MIVGAALGFVYGLALAILAALAAGAGHGTYVLSAISSAPLGLLGTVPAVLGAPIVWAVVGALAGMRGARRSVIALLVAHYAGAIWLTREELLSASYVFLQIVRANPVLALMWTLIYLAGQYLLWLTIIRSSGEVVRQRR